ncbi:uncharacterized protein RHO25_006274 [Cercospora beticola]|uniref:Fungal N-terminal domain-containing protein n=2 Tax=Cercospora beticola TaxID=122368 RepID=A0ABZ0NQ11_CERBT|nr:hypothetical protein RHO25_006274 [Cercospora beticola]
MQILTARIALSFTLIATCSLHPEHFTSPAQNLINDAAKTISESVVMMANTAYELSSQGLETKSDMQDPAWCIFPMRLLQLSLKLSTVSEDQCAIKYHMQHLRRYMEAHRQRWDGIDRVLSKLNALGPPNVSGTDSPAPAMKPSWDLASMSHGVTHRLFRKYLTSYLRLGTAYNLCISNSTATYPQDLPPILRSDHCDSTPTTEMLVAGDASERFEPGDEFTSYDHDGEQHGEWRWDRLFFHDALLGDLDDSLGTYATW